MKPLRSIPIPTGGAEGRPQLGPDQAAMSGAAKLMQQLAALVPIIAAQARDPAAAAAWVDSWARQIQHHRLTDADLAAGLAAVGRLPLNLPFSFPWFLEAVKAARPRREPLPPPPTRLQDLPGWTPEGQARGEKLMAAIRAARATKEWRS